MKVTGEHARGFRDHVLFSVALGTGLREHELLALNVGDMIDGRRKVKRRVTLRVFKGCESASGPQEVVLPDGVVYKLGRYLKWKAKRGESVATDAPLFVSRNGNRLSLTDAGLAIYPQTSRALEDIAAMTLRLLRRAGLVRADGVATGKGRARAAKALRDERRWEVVRSDMAHEATAALYDGLRDIETVLTQDQIAEIDRRIGGPQEVPA